MTSQDATGHRDDVAAPGQRCGDGAAVGDAEPPVRRWREHAERLVGQLTGAGLLRAARWQHAVLNVPRHLFGPGPTDPTAMTEAQLSALYTDPTLWLEHPPPLPIPGEAIGLAPPSVLAWALDHLDPGTEPQRVLQVGAGSGYLTALLCYGLGDRHVVATEPDPNRADTTRVALAEFGWHPEIVTGSPGAATAAQGRYDVVLAVEPAPGADCATDARVGRERVACLGQLAPCGRMVVAGPASARTTHPVATVTRAPAGRLSCEVADPHYGVRGDRLCVEFLADDIDLRAVLLARHVAAPDGCCHACAEDHGIVEPFPCRVRVIAETAARLAIRRSPRQSGSGAGRAEFSRSQDANPRTLGE